MLDDPRTQLLDVDYRGQHAEPGSRPWIITQRSLMVACLSDIRNNRMVGRAVFEKIKQHGGWEHLEDLRKRPFHSFEAFCRSANGLGLEPAEIERRLTAQDLAQDEKVKPLANHGGKRKKGAQGDIITLGRGTSAAYLVARLKRDHPRIARDLAAGKYRSARAAARAAGIVVDLSPLDRLHLAWRLASQEERHAFLNSLRKDAA